MMKKKTGPADRSERVEKGGQRYYRKTDRKPVPLKALFSVLGDIQKAILPKDELSPSVTSVLQVLAKPALISWAARNEREYVSKLAARIYSQVVRVSAEPISEDKFIEMIVEEAGKPRHRTLLEEAGRVGTQVHNRIEWEFKGELGLEREAEPPTLQSEQAKRSFERWKEWRAKVKLKPLMMEHRLYSSIFGFGGTLDLLAEVTIPVVEGGQFLNGIVSEDHTELTIVVIIDFKTGKHVYEEAFLQNAAYRAAMLEEGIETQGGIIVRLPKYEADPEFDAVTVPEDPLLLPVFLALRLAHQWVEAHKPVRPNKKGVSKTGDSGYNGNESNPNPEKGI